jgi:hypothetical protein
MPEQGLASEALRCPSCNFPVTAYAPEVSTNSLWHCYGTILSLPLRNQSGLFLLSLLVVFILTSLVGLPLYISLIGSAFFALVYGVQPSSRQAKTKTGQARIPLTNLLFKLDMYRAALPTLCVVVASTLTCAFLFLSHHYVAFVVVMAALLFTLPVVAVIEGQEERPVGLSPLSYFVQVMANLGPNYIALCSWGLLLVYAGLVGIDGLQTFAPAFIQSAAAPVLVAYLILVWQTAVGLSMPMQFSAAGADSRSKYASSVTNIEEVQIGIALREGKYDRVFALLESDYYRNGMSDYRLEQLYKLSLAQNRHALLVEYGAVFMSMLVRRGRDEEALSLLFTLRKKREDYRVADAQLCLNLVKSCERKKKQKLLLWLVQDAHWRFPQDQILVAEMYRSAAKVLHKCFRQHAKALAYMKKAAQARDMHENNNSKAHTPL